MIFAMCVSLSIWQRDVTAKTPEKPTNDTILDFVEEAFHAQVSLGNQFYTIDQVTHILSPYFTNDYMALFNAENLVEQNGKYITYGKDFALYYVPFFTYSEQTKVAFDDNSDTIFVYEFFKATGEGMIIKDHYRTIVLNDKEDQLQIKDVFFSEQSPVELKDTYQKYSLVY